MTRRPSSSARRVRDAILPASASFADWSAHHEANRPRLSLRPNTASSGFDVDAGDLISARGREPLLLRPRFAQQLRDPLPAEAGHVGDHRRCLAVWGAKIRCPPEKSAICRQDANFGTPHALASATQKASPPAGQAVSSSTTMRKRSLIPPCPQAVAASDGITRIRESADAELVLGEREAGAQGRVGDNEVTTSEASLSAPSARLGRESHRDGNEVAAPTNGSPLSSGKNPAGRRRNQRRLLESRLRSPAQCTSLRHRE